MTTVTIAALPPLPDTAVNQESPITDNEDTEKRFEHVSKEESGPNIDLISEELDPNLVCQRSNNPFVS